MNTVNVDDSDNDANDDNTTKGKSASPRKDKSISPPTGDIHVINEEQEIKDTNDNNDTKIESKTNNDDIKDETKDDAKVIEAPKA
eukprot:CAMPEP_0114680122 /NCGR_PEP_ID=MMETSP0191-20121206/53715_1 /TAXON_ID=126664 /ORGANISM="Sorites sp." /LENGTH=84 /DNA_ID=CAMNT_0001956395 /DNA_START=1606 /DNA_END=1856 /DNA_ORIENTATION=-